MDRTFEKKIDRSIAPGPPLLGRRLRHRIPAGGTLPARPHRLGHPAPSNISIYGNFTTEKFVLHCRFSGQDLQPQQTAAELLRRIRLLPRRLLRRGFTRSRRVTRRTSPRRWAPSASPTAHLARGPLYIGVSGGIDYSGAKYERNRHGGIHAADRSGEAAGKPVPGGDGRALQPLANATTLRTQDLARTTSPRRATSPTPATPMSGFSPSTTRAT